MKTPHAILLCSALIWPAALPAAGFPGPLKVTFRTTDCDGATGMGNVNADQVSRVQPYACANGRQLKQVLVKSASGSHEVFTVTEDEAVKLEAQIRQVMDARRKALEQTQPIQINR